ncbi:hypothetical protein [Erwinia endophytica]|nr:hypothetical protein [Erwinia endophytica]
MTSDLAGLMPGVLCPGAVGRHVQVFAPEAVFTGDADVAIGVIQ